MLVPWKVEGVPPPKKMVFTDRLAQASDSE